MSLRQPARGHRAGTDAVLLAAAAPVRSGDLVLDIGAATGSVGLMVAIRVPDARYVFVERDPELAALCGFNCQTNGIDGRMAVADILDPASRREADLSPETADVVLTNPPFLEEGLSRISPDVRRAAAHSLPRGGLAEWLSACLVLLKPKGRLALIHRADRLEECLAILAKRLGGVEIRFIHPRADQPAIRFLLTGTKASRAPLTIAPPLILNDAEGRFTPQAEALHRGEAYLT